MSWEFWIPLGCLAYAAAAIGVLDWQGRQLDRKRREERGE